MNGTVFIGIQRFVRSRVGDDGWRDVVRTAGVPPRLYVPVAEYPDQEAVALLSAMSAKSGQPIQAGLEALGAFMAPDLITMVKFLIASDWKTIDLIANTEGTIHEALRGAGTHTAPPVLRTSRSGPKEAVVVYTSPRKMCALAKGIIMGVAAYYGERVMISEPTCMLKGDAECTLVVTTE